MMDKDDFMIIPKPKFKVGDRVVATINGCERTLCTLTSSLYNPERQEWGYGAKDYSNKNYQQEVHYIYNLAGWESNYRLANESEPEFN